MSIFSNVYFEKPRRSTFRLHPERKMSFEPGRIVPIFLEETLPTDRWSVRTDMKIELTPLIAPLFHNVDLYIYYFYAPNRILSAAWNDWITQGEPATNMDIPSPFRFNLSKISDNVPAKCTQEELKDRIGPGTLADYLGFSTNPCLQGFSGYNRASLDQLKSYSAFPFLMYNAVWLNFFRNENLVSLPNGFGTPSQYIPQYDKVTNISLSDWKSYNWYYRNSFTVPFDAMFVLDDEDSITSIPESRLFPTRKLRHANFMHDYFTSALPFVQRGPIVTIPIAEKANITGTASTVQGTRTVLGGARIGDPSGLQFSLPKSWSPGIDHHDSSDYIQTGKLPTETTAKLTPSTDRESPGVFGITGASGNMEISGQINSLPVDVNNLEVDLSESTGISIRDLRKLSRLNEWIEKNTYGGNTPEENIYAHFGIYPGDSRVSKPVFLGGGRVPIQISNVLQTSQSTNDSPQASPSGYARTIGGAGFSRYLCREHGFILGVAYLMPRPSYQQGTRRMWDRSDRFDYFWTEFERIGDQPVFGFEIFDDGTFGTTDEPTENQAEFGYAPRYSEYKYIPSTVHGDFLTSLSFWHASRIFSERPMLNQSFLHLGSDFDRIFAVDSSVSTQKIWSWLRHSIKVTRPMHRNPTPIL